MDRFDLQVGLQKLVSDFMHPEGRGPANAKDLVVELATVCGLVTSLIVKNMQDDLPFESAPEIKTPEELAKRIMHQMHEATKSSFDVYYNDRAFKVDTEDKSSMEATRPLYEKRELGGDGTPH